MWKYVMSAILAALCAAGLHFGVGVAPDCALTTCIDLMPNLSR